MRAIGAWQSYHILAVLFLPSSSGAAPAPRANPHVYLKKGQGKQMIGMVEGDVYVVDLITFEVPFCGDVLLWTQKG